MSQQLVDINHWFGGDLSASPVGDFAQATGTLRGQQRVLRRLLTNPGSYMQQPEYGAGLGQFVGSTATDAELSAVIRTQIALEPAVSKTPAPQITLTRSNTTLSVVIQYTDAATGQPVVLTIPVGGSGGT